MIKRKKILYGIFTCIVVVLSLAFLLYKYTIHNYTPIRNIEALEYELGLNTNLYFLEVKNIQVAVDYNNQLGDFTLPYVLISSYNKNDNLPYIVYLRGGPLNTNHFLSFRHSSIYDDIITDYIRWTVGDLLEHFNIIYIDDRVNDIGQVINCNTVEIPWDDYFNQDYNVSLDCNKDISIIKEILSDESDTKDIKSILDAENITKAHFIGESFGARRAVNFIKNYPQMVSSFTSFHGDIYNMKSLNDLDDIKNYYFKNLDGIYTNSIYQWPFSKKPSEIAEQFDLYLKKHLSKQDYFHIVGTNSNYPEIGYVPLEENFDLLIGESTTLNLPKKSKVIVRSNYDNLRDIRLCDTYMNGYDPNTTYNSTNHYIQNICGFHGKNKEDIFIPDDIAVQVIYAGLDRRVITSDHKDMIFNSNNMSIAIYEDAEHGDCQEESFKDIIIPFLENLKPIDLTKTCFDFSFYDYLMLKDTDLFDAKIPPNIKRKLF